MQICQMSSMMTRINIIKRPFASFAIGHLTSSKESIGTTAGSASSQFVANAQAANASCLKTTKLYIACAIFAIRSYQTLSLSRTKT
jgi:hypothetical protein